MKIQLKSQNNPFLIARCPLPTLPQIILNQTENLREWKKETFAFRYLRLNIISPRRVRRALEVNEKCSLIRSRANEKFLVNR